MITDPTTLLALALCVGILGLIVLILPLLILFWSQMEPQLVALVSSGGSEADDEYQTQSVLPRLMKSFGHMAEIEQEKQAISPARRAPAKSNSRKPATTARSQATTTSKTVKAAPAMAKAKAPANAKPKVAAKAKPKNAATAAKTSTKLAKASSSAAAKSKSGTTTKSKAATTASKATAKTDKPAKATAKTAKPAKAKAAAKPAAKRRTPAGAKRDPILGIVYSKKPKEVDDLKQIKGVAKVIEGKLNQAGIFTYRQIVEWDAAAINAFSEKLSFKGRIRNEEWQKQCGMFHNEKYGEKMS
ncbi:MAG: putative flap endonuclease-1-like 5' DNA nuclease [Verrucomicrobiales bacterium]|jgi:predicted flap endonuclease-1-like 5' DNA nuclease